MTSQKESQTCGQGLAANSWLPAKLSDVISAMADVLENHKSALNVDEATGRQEFDAYASLVNKYGEIADRLDEAAAEMKGYRDLAMAEHDKSVMTSSQSLTVFQRLVKAKEELRQMLDETSSQDAKLLAQMQG